MSKNIISEFEERIKRLETMCILIQSEIQVFRIQVQSKFSRLDELEDNETDPTTNERRLIPLSKWNEYHDYPSVSGLRHLVFFAKDNGFDIVLKRIGKRIYIDEQAFFSWVDKSKELNDSNK